MDPRMRQVLVMLLELVLEQTQERDPLAEEAPERKSPYPPGTLGYDLQQLEPVASHRVWPFSQPADHNFGGP